MIRIGRGLRVWGLMVAMVLGGMLLLIPGEALWQARAVGAILVFVVLPGTAIVGFLDPERSSGELVGLSIACGLSVHILMAVVSYLLRLRFEIVTVVAIVVTIALVAASMITGRPRRTVGARWNPDVILVFILAAGLAVLMYRIGSVQGGDTVSHLTWIRKLFERRMADPSVHVWLPGETLWAPYTYNGWHLLVAWLSWVARVDPVVLWIHAPTLLVVLSVICVWEFSKRLFRSARVGLVVTCSFVAIAGAYSGCWIWRLSPYPDQLAKILMFPALYAMIRYCQSGRRRWLAASSILFLVLTLTHVSSAFHWAILTAMYLLATLLRREWRIHARRAAVALGSALLAASPWLILKVVTLYGGGFGIGGMEPEEFLHLGAGWYVVHVNPFSLHDVWSPIYTAMILSVPLLVHDAFRRRETGALFLLSSIVGLMMVLYNPLVVTLIIRVLNGNLASRAAYLYFFCSVVTLGYVVSRLLDVVTRKLRVNPYRAVLVSGLLVVFGIMGGWVSRLPWFPDYRSLASTIMIRKQDGFLMENRDLISWVEEETSEQSAIIVRRPISDLVGVYMDRYPMPSRAAIVADRVNHLLSVLAPLSSEDLQLLAEYDIRYVLATTSDDVYKLIQYPDVFTELAAHPPHTLFGVNLSHVREALDSIVE